MRQGKILIITLLVIVLYVKFFFQVVLKMDHVILDLIIYPFLIAAMNYKKIRLEFIIIVGYVLISFINPACRNIFLLFFVTYLLNDYSLYKLALLNCLLGSLVFLTICFLLQGGVLHSEMFAQTLLDTRERWDFGFGNPNTLALFTYAFLLNLYVFFRGKYKFLMLCILLIGGGVYFYTVSRTFIISMCVWGLFYIALYFKSLKSLVSNKYFLYSLPYILIGGLFFFVFFASDYPLVNMLFSGRLSLYNQFMTSIGIKDYLFGTVEINEATIDNSYFHLIFEGGIGTLLIFLFLWYKGIKNITPSDNYLIPILVATLCYAVTESIFTYVLIWGNMIIWLLLYKKAFDLKCA